jgi:hypothetical protein
MKMLRSAVCLLILGLVALGLGPSCSWPDLERHELQQVGRAITEHRDCDFQPGHHHGALLLPRTRQFLKLLSAFAVHDGDHYGSGIDQRNRYPDRAGDDGKTL